MSRTQLSRDGRQVRRVKTTSHHKDETSAGCKREEGTVKLTDFDAWSG